jgi:hypothetical protein
LVAACQQRSQRLRLFGAHFLGGLLARDAAHIQRQGPARVRFGAPLQQGLGVANGHRTAIHIAGVLIDIMQVLQDPPARTRLERTIQRKDTNPLLR